MYQEAIEIIISKINYVAVIHVLKNFFIDLVDNKLSRRS